MKCPKCDKQMEEVKTSCKYGISIVLDQCPECGGVWFDNDELYRAKHGVAADIEKKLNVRKLRKKSLLSGAAKCPRDKSPLKAFKNNYFKDDLEMDICPRCDGIWMNCGEFSEWQNHKLIKSVNASKSRKLTLDKAELLALEQDIQKQAAALVKYHGMIEKSKTQRAQRENRSTLLYVVYVILRIIFFRGR